jgi:hypothetical protein
VTTSTASRTRLFTAAEWTGVLTGPTAWTIHLWFNYGLEEFVACAPGARGRVDFLGIETRVWVLVSNAALAAVVLAVGLFCVARYRRLRREDTTTGRRAEWMALSGILLNALFLLVIVAGLAPGVVLESCARSP